MKVAGYDKKLHGGKEFWHVCTPGEMQSIIFRNREEYVFGMNIVALCAGIFRKCISIYTFQLMSNHVHFIIEGNEENTIGFFNEFKKRMSKYYALKGDSKLLENFSPSIFRINDINYLRNSITYVNRNGYLVNRDYNPFSYPWGANKYFFNYSSSEKIRVGIGKIPIRLKRKIFHTHYNEFPENFYFTEDYISPECYVKIKSAMQLFRDAHQYFNLISRRVETFSEIARELGDKVICTDDEIYSAIYSLGIKKFEMPPKSLSPEQKMEIAKELRFNYNASNKQISRTLHLEMAILNELFPDSQK